MDEKTFETGAAIRAAVLGQEHVDRSLRSSDAFVQPFQEFLTEYCWGAVWGRDGLSHKTRSMLNLAMLAALNREHEFKLHVGGALRNGLTWHFSRPPIVGLDYEMDCRRVHVERVV